MWWLLNERNEGWSACNESLTVAIEEVVKEAEDAIAMQESMINEKKESSTNEIHDVVKSDTDKE